MNDFTVRDMRDLIGDDHGLILEIGANEADSTVEFLAAMPEAVYHCFEPDPRAIAKFKARNLPSTVHLYEVALSDKIGTAEFHQSDGRPPDECWKDYGEHWDKSGSLLPNHRHTRYSQWLSFLPPITVPTTTLDAWAAEHLPAETTRIDFLWIDVQGSELLVVRGGPQTLKRTRYAYLECDPRPLYRGMAKLRDLQRALRQLGFAYVQEYGGFNHLFKNRKL